MKIKISARIRNLLSCNVTRLDNPNRSTDLDFQKEYANAFRTQSYTQFWTRVLALGNRDSALCKTMGSTTAARLPSYRLFVDHLLDPDQPTVTLILTLAQNHLQNHPLISEYFTVTAEASLLCGLLLKNIDCVKYGSIRNILESLETVRFSSINHLSKVLTGLTEFSNSINPFVSWASSPCRVQALQDSCSELTKRLESSRDKVRAKLRLKKIIKRGSAIFLVALTASLTVVAVTHGLPMLVAAPSITVASLELVSTRRLARLSAQLDAAAKGTYILSRDLDIISRLVARLNDELEHMRATVRFWLKRGEDRLQASGEVARQLKMNDASFREQLDELEEHLYLCFMTINRARNLVMKEILDPGWNISAPSLISKQLLPPS